MESTLEGRRALVRVPDRLGRRLTGGPERSEKGQSMLEMTFGTVFLVLIVLVLFEMAMLFYSYIAVLNASREGAVYASEHPDMVSGTVEYAEFEAVTREEANAAGLITDTAFFQIDAPILGPASEFPRPITVTVHYQIVNPTQGIILPTLGRMGLFQSAWMTAFTEMPIRLEH
jgi:Flp pilus assembly protein TadG